MADFLTTPTVVSTKSQEAEEGLQICHLWSPLAGSLSSDETTTCERVSYGPAHSFPMSWKESLQVFYHFTLTSSAGKEAEASLSPRKLWYRHDAP